MSLGVDNAISKTEFIEAMRARLEAKEAGLGDNVDDPEVQANLGALAQAVFRINTVLAETLSDSSSDNDFWTWINEVNVWINEMNTWQQNVKQAFTDWAPADAPGQDLRTALLGIADPSVPPALSPSQLRGVIE